MTNPDSIFFFFYTMKAITKYLTQTVNKLITTDTFILAKEN